MGFILLMGNKTSLEFQESKGSQLNWVYQPANNKNYFSKVFPCWEKKKQLPLLNQHGNLWPRHKNLCHITHKEHYWSAIFSCLVINLLEQLSSRMTKQVSFALITHNTLTALCQHKAVEDTGRNQLHDEELYKLLISPAPPRAELSRLLPPTITKYLEYLSNILHNFKTETTVFH